MSSETVFDVVIVGGGMVGAALAAKLGQGGLQVALVERQPPAEYAPEQPLDMRVSAINRHAQQLLADVGAWPLIQQMRSCLFRRMSVWDCGAEQMSALHFDAADIQASHLGHIVENRLIQLALWQVLAQESTVTCFSPAEIRQIFTSGTTGSGAAAGSESQGGREQPVGVELADGTQVLGQLLVGADGANSMVRQAAGIGLTAWEYDQHLLAVNVETAYEQQDITWQEFHPGGPRAFLPLPGHHASLVWYDKPARIRELKQLPDSELKQQIQAAFPERLGEFTLLERAAFPLVRRHAQDYSKDRVVILGDAAHTINPLAGQGVNLGFKDVQVLGEQLCAAHLADEPLSGAPLKRFERRRRPDNLVMQSMMDACYLAFGNQLAPLKLLRNLGLGVADRAGPLKHQVMKYAMGL